MQKLTTTTRKNNSAMLKRNSKRNIQNIKRKMTLRGGAYASASAGKLSKNRFISYDHSFCEQQASLGCGRHALNNLLGGAVFSKDSKDSRYSKKIDINPQLLSTFNLSLKPQFPLNDYCEYMRQNVDNYPCQDDENYNIEVIQSVLAIMGYYVDTVDIRDGNCNARDKSDENFIGYIANNNSHWFAYKHIGDCKLKHIDSQECIQSKKNIPITQDNILKEAKLQRFKHLLRVSWAGVYMGVDNFKLSISEEQEEADFQLGLRLSKENNNTKKKTKTREEREEQEEAEFQKAIAQSEEQVKKNNTNREEQRIKEETYREDIRNIEEIMNTWTNK